MRAVRSSADVEAWLIGEDGAFVREAGALDHPRIESGSLSAGDVPWLGGPLEAGGPARSTRSGDRNVAAVRLGLPSIWSGEPWLIVVSEPSSAVLGDFGRFSRWMVTVVALFALVCVGAAFLAARRLARPLEQLAAYARRLAGGGFDREFAVKSGDEIDDLGGALQDTARQLREARAALEADNSELREELEERLAENVRLLHDRMAAERQILRADRLASLGLLSTTLAHEIGNPLGGIRANLELAAEQGGDEAVWRRALLRAQGEIDRLGTTLKRFTGFARAASLAPGSAAPLDVVRDVWELLEARARHQGTRLEVGGPAADLAVPMDVAAFRQICLNLLLNSLQAEPAPRRVAVQAAQVDSVLEVAFDDDGPGIPADDRERVFEPLVTSRPEGTGLGLSIVRTLVGQHGAAVTATASPLGGARILIRWPLGGVPREAR
jgi:two-component system NtrC family sensor kinase